MLEREILKVILEFLRLSRPSWLVWRQNQGAIPLKHGGFRRFVGLHGVADILGVLPGGRFLAIEVKRPGGMKSAEQETFLSQVADLGGVALCVSSLDELIKDLEELGL